MSDYLQKGHIGDIVRLEEENDQLRTQLKEANDRVDELIAWHEGDRSPHAKLEQEPQWWKEDAERLYDALDAATTCSLLLGGDKCCQCEENIKSAKKQHQERISEK